MNNQNQLNNNNSINNNAGNNSALPGASLVGNGSSSSTSSSSLVSSTDKEEWRILPKFDGQVANWPTFKTIFKGICKYKKLEDVLLYSSVEEAMNGANSAAGAAATTSSSAPAPTTKIVPTNVEREAWQDKSMKVYLILIMSMNSIAVQQLLLPPAAKEGDAYSVWKILCNKYERKTQANKTQVMNALLTQKMKEGGADTIQTYGTRIRSLAGQLKDMGET
ncbi:MAG TPA: hypothetical protein VHD33_07580, partial [Legionellaceae bacterium]|nr:hypothetical protein [Legionellaceae bacterium]